MKVCLDLCHPSVGKNLHAYIYPSKRKTRNKRYLFSSGIQIADTSESDNHSRAASVQIIQEQPTTHCAIIHICSRMTLEGLAKEKVSLSTAKKVSRYWRKSILVGPSQYANLLSRIRCLILAELQKHKMLNLPVPTKMTEIIKEASNTINRSAFF